MTTAELEAAANRGNLATADFDIKFTLRDLVVPAFLEDIGETSWRKKLATISVLANDREYDLPNDFFYMKHVYAPSASLSTQASPPELTYIGEDDLKLAQAERATVAGTPSGYYIVLRGTAGSEFWKAIKLDVPPSAAFTLHYVYINHPHFTDSTTSVELDPFIPRPLQAGLIHGLRALIMFDRYGVGDKRGEAEMKLRDMVVDRAKYRKELGSRNYAVFVN